jgi:hypothetical protein
VSATPDQQVAYVKAVVYCVVERSMTFRLADTFANWHRRIGSRAARKRSSIQPRTLARRTTLTEPRHPRNQAGSGGDPKRIAPANT